MATRRSPVEQSSMVGSERRHRIGFFLWALVACPAIGLGSWWSIDPDDEAIASALLWGVPGALSLVGGLWLLRDRAVAILGATLGAAVGAIALVALIGATQGS